MHTILESWRRSALQYCPHYFMRLTLWTITVLLSAYAAPSHMLSSCCLMPSSSLVWLIDALSSTVSARGSIALEPEAICECSLVGFHFFCLNTPFFCLTPQMLLPDGGSD